MERTTFLHHYRIRVRDDGTPYELNGDGATSYEAVDERTGEPVSLKLIAADSIDPTVRNQFEEQALMAQKLRHINVAKVVDFGREADDFVYVSERLPGETLEDWVRSHGPMPIDAALRVAEQIVSVLSSASFHKLPLPSIAPADIIIIPGQTPEGTWPLVKVTNVGLPPLTTRTDPETTKSDTLTPAAATEGTAVVHQTAVPTTDIGSEISSLGATLYFALTGVTLASDTRHSPPKLSRLPKSLRVFLAKLWHPNPDKRPKDLVVLAEMIRQCLLRFERRREFADRYGIPYRRAIARPVKPRPARLLRWALAAGLLLLIAAVVAAALFPDTISSIVHGNRSTKDIGVLVGVPDSSSQTAAQNASTTGGPSATSHTAPAAPVVAQAPMSSKDSKEASTDVASQSANSPAPSGNQPPVNAAADSNSPQVRSQDVNGQIASDQTSSGQTQTAPADAPPPVSANVSPQTSSGEETKSQAHVDSGAESSAASSSRKTKNVASSRRTHVNPSLSEDLPQRGTRSVRARVVGITSDGRLILRLPSGRTGIVAPDSESEFVPRRHRRAVREPDETFGPPPQFGPDFPDD